MRTTSSSAAVVAASVVFAVMMVTAMEIGSDLECACNKGFRNIPDIAVSSANYLDSCICKGVDGSSADAAANENINIFDGKKSC